MRRRFATSLVATSLATFILPAPIASGQTVATASLSTQGIPPRDTRPAAQSGTAEIGGRIVAADTGQPLRRAQLKLAAPALGQDGVTVSTDADGRYEITKLPAGRYTLQVTRSGYLALSYGQRRPLEQAKPLQVLDHQIIQHVDFALAKMGVITGRITDELGDPMAGVQVFAMRSQYLNGQRRMAPSQATESDEEGEYRLINLAPSTYVVLAKARDKWTADDTGREETFGYAPTYLPGTTRVADARRITIGSGETASNADFSMIAGRTARISGSATDSHGQPLTRVILVQETMGPGGGTVGIAGNAVVAPDGTFTIRDVPPGEYKLQAAGAQESAVQGIVVDSIDIEHVTLTTSAGWSFTGTIVTEDGSSPSLSRNRVRISSRSLAGINAMGMPDGIRSRQAINDDWTFAVTGVSGLARLDVTLPDGWIVKAVRHEVF